MKIASIGIDIGKTTFHLTPIRPPPTPKTTPSGT